MEILETINSVGDIAFDSSFTAFIYSFGFLSGLVTSEILRRGGK